MQALQDEIVTISLRHLKRAHSQQTEGRTEGGKQIIFFVVLPLGRRMNQSATFQCAALEPVIKKLSYARPKSANKNHHYINASGVSHVRFHYNCA